MRLLLLLSALLAALTGAGAGARPPGVQAAVAASVRVAAPERVRAHAALATRPRGVVAAEPAALALAVPRPQPVRLWAQRRRE